ncbi:MAG: flippase-like domain-containing protein, partial [Actinomycetota bacterium]|nr:flippase-like domain-containing protein [Actinomycetota bacterium]
MHRSKTLVLAGVALLILSGAAVAALVDVGALRATADAVRARPAGLGVALAAYGAAFTVRAQLWRRVLPDLSFGQALAALHVSLAGNHLLPLRLGEALRVTSVVRRTDVGLPAATASTLTLRAADVLVVAGIAALGGPVVLSTPAGGWLWLVVAVAAAVAVAGVVWLRRLPAASRLPVRVPAAGILAGSSAAWALESVVIWQATRWAGLDLSAGDAVLVTAVTIAAQVVAFAPGGLGT